MRQFSCKSKTETMVGILCNYIIQNKLQRDSLLPSEVKLQRMFSLSRITIRRSLDCLVDQEVVYKRKGSGTYVLNPNRASQIYESEISVHTTIRTSPELWLGFVFFERAKEEINDTLHFDTYIGASTVVREENCHLELIALKEPMLKKEMTEILLERKLDGIITSRPTEELFQVVEEFRIPTVIYGGEYSRNFDYVDDDNETGGTIATKYLKSLGHQKIVFVDCIGYDARYKHRRNGFIKAFELEGKGYPHDLIWLYNGPGSLDDKIIKERPAAIFAAGDSIAVEIAESINRLGLKIPQDISLVGYDNRPSSISAYPDLTTISCSRREIGAQGINALRNRIKMPENSKKKIFIEPELIIRNSCRSI